MLARSPNEVALPTTIPARIALRNNSRRLVSLFIVGSFRRKCYLNARDVATLTKVYSCFRFTVNCLSYPYPSTVIAKSMTSPLTFPEYNKVTGEP